MWRCTCRGGGAGAEVMGRGRLHRGLTRMGAAWALRCWTRLCARANIAWGGAEIGARTRRFIRSEAMAVYR